MIALYREAELLKTCLQAVSKTTRHVWVSICFYLHGKI